MSIKEEIQRLQHKAELIELAQALIVADSLFKPASTRGINNSVVIELTRAVKDFLSRYISAIESDIHPSYLTTLTVDDVQKLKLISERLESLPAKPAIKSTDKPIKSNPIAPAQVSAVPVHKADKRPVPIERRGILLDTTSAFNFNGPPNIDGMPSKDTLSPDTPVVVLSETPIDYRVRQGLVEFSIAKECVEII